MVYATKMSVAEYRRRRPMWPAPRTGLEFMKRGEILGVTTCAMAKEFEQEQCGFANHLNLAMPLRDPDQARRLCHPAGQTVRVDPSATHYRLRFFEQDSYPVGTAGYHFNNTGRRTGYLGPGCGIRRRAGLG